MNKSKERQFIEFVAKLLSGKVVTFEFHLDYDWYEFHQRFEERNGDLIQGVTERFIDGDDELVSITFNWAYNAVECSFECSKCEDGGIFETFKSYSIHSEFHDFAELFIEDLE